MSDTPPSAAHRFRFFPIAILLTSIIFLFVAPRLGLEWTKPSVDLTNWMEVMHDTNVTGPEGNTVSFDEALKNGWLGVSATRFADSYTVSPKGMEVPLSGVMVAYKVSNKTTKPIHMRIGNTVTPKTLDIPPGDTQQVGTIDREHEYKFQRQ